MLKEKRMRAVDPGEQQFNAGPRIWALVTKKIFATQSLFGSWYGSLIERCLICGDIKRCKEA
jgi:hypothetical protein